MDEITIDVASLQQKVNILEEYINVLNRKHKSMQNIEITEGDYAKIITSSKTKPNVDDIIQHMQMQVDSITSTVINMI